MGPSREEESLFTPLAETLSCFYIFCVRACAHIFKSDRIRVNRGDSYVTVLTSLPTSLPTC